MSAAHERVTSPVPAGAAMPADRDEAACVLFGEIGAGTSFYDVLSFLGRARWRGELIVQIDEVRRSVYFDEGNVIAAQTSARGERIGEVLLGAGVLTREQVDACVVRMGDGSLRFGEAAVELGYVSAEELFRAMDRQLEAIFGAVVCASHGAFYFFLDYDEESLSFRQRHRIDSLLVKAISRIEEATYFRARIPSTDHVPARVAERGAPTEDRLGIYAAVDGRRTVSQIRELCGGADELDVMRGLYELVQRGYVAIDPPRIGVNRVVGVYNDAIALLLRELDAMDEGDAVREKLARFADAAPAALFADAGPAHDGTFDGPRIESNVAAIVDAEERVARWLYDYASYALFLARPHLQRRDGAHPPRDAARVSMRVAALLAPLAPKSVVVTGMPPRATLPVLATPKGAPEPAKTAKLSRTFELPGVDPTRTVRMAPISEERLARRPAPPARLEPSPGTPPRAAPAAPAVALRLSAPMLAGLLVVVAGAAALVTAVALRSGSGGEGRPSGAGAEVVIACEPECAAVHVDGAPMDATHGTFAVAPGAHEIVAMRPGFRTEVRRVAVTAGESRAVALVLAPAAD